MKDKGLIYIGQRCHLYRKKVSIISNKVLVYKGQIYSYRKNHLFGKKVSMHEKASFKCKKEIICLEQRYHLYRTKVSKIEVPLHKFSDGYSFTLIPSSAHAETFLVAA